MPPRLRQSVRSSDFDVARALAIAAQVRPKAKEIYDEDFHICTALQAELLCQQRFEALVLDHQIEEVAGVGPAARTCEVRGSRARPASRRAWKSFRPTPFFLAAGRCSN